MCQNDYKTSSIWLILEICRWFLQFVFTLLPRVRPIKVGILNHFLRVADHGLLTVLINFILKKISLRVRFYRLKLH